MKLPRGQKTRDKIEKRGFSITTEMGYRNGIQCIKGYTAIRKHCKFFATTLTELNIKTR